MTELKEGNRLPIYRCAICSYFDDTALRYTLKAGNPTRGIARALRKGAPARVIAAMLAGARGWTFLKALVYWGDLIKQAKKLKRNRK